MTELLPFPMRVLAVDPGDVHNGVARFTVGGPIVARHWTRDWTHDTLYSFIESNKDEIDVLVIEGFRLYPELAFEQGYSDFPTVQTIGVLKDMATRRFHFPHFEIQGAAVKRKARRIGERLKAPGRTRTLGSGRGKYVGWDFDATTQHERDATAHGVWWAFRNENSPAYETDNLRRGGEIKCL